MILKPKQNKKEDKEQKKEEAPNKFKAYEKPVQRMTLKYLLSLIMFFVLAFDGYLVLQGSLKSAQYSAHKITISGRQLTLFEQTVLISDEIVNTPSLRKKWELNKKLEKVVSLFEESHKALVNGSTKMHLPANTSPSVNSLYFEEPVFLEKHIQNYIKALRYFLNADENEVLEENKGYIYIHKVRDSHKVTNALNKLINIYLTEHELTIGELQNMENMIFMCTILIVIISGMFIFRPMVKEVKNSFAKLEVLTETLDQRVQERTASLTKTNKELVAEVEMRKQTEDELRKSGELFKTITENMADLVAVVGIDGKRLYNNPAYKRIFGDGSVKQGSDSFNEIHPEDKPKIKQAFEDVIGLGTPQTAEYRFLLKDGKVVYIESVGSLIRNAQGQPEHVIIVARDITERKMRESQQQEQEQNNTQMHIQNQAPAPPQTSAPASGFNRPGSIFGSPGQSFVKPQQDLTPGQES